MFKINHLKGVLKMSSTWNIVSPDDLTLRFLLSLYITLIFFYIMGTINEAHFSALFLPFINLFIILHLTFFNSVGQGLLLYFPFHLLKHLVILLVRSITLQFLSKAHTDHDSLSCYITTLLHHLDLSYFI